MITEQVDALAEPKVDPNMLFVFQKTKTPATMYQMFEENQDLQLPYTKESVENQMYRRWINQLPMAQLLLFEQENEKRINAMLENKVMPPSIEKVRYLISRNFLYEVELHRRRFGWDEAAKHTVYLDCYEELRLLEERFATALTNWYSSAVVDDAADTAPLPY